MNKSAAKKMKQRSAGKPDIELGKRIRLRRVEQRISQAELGDQLGVSFQQVQKYEKGVNRVGAGRLTKIAEVLGITVGTFFTGKEVLDTEHSINKDNGEASPLKLLTVSGAFRLLRAYADIEDSNLRRSIVDLVERISANPR
jgi:transcriptional regulator with XRE-family HTH domain